VSQVAVGTRLRLAELVRQPLTLALLIALPPVVIEVYGVGIASFPALPGLGTDAATAGRIAGTLFSVAFLAGLIGLFQVISARRGDERALVAGFAPTALLIGRLVAMFVLATAGAVVAYAVFSFHVSVAAPLVAFATLLLAGAVYGLLGAIVGAVLPRELEGSLVLVFLADIDNALSSGLFAFDVWFVEYAPLYHANALFSAAVLDGTAPTEHLWPTLALIAGLAVLAIVAYGWSTTGNVPHPGRWLS
jgi:ABC-2 type transport system permease protein